MWKCTLLEINVLTGYLNRLVKLPNAASILGVIKDSDQQSFALKKNNLKRRRNYV